jgi:hypothetical protein
VCGPSPHPRDLFHFREDEKAVKDEKSGQGTPGERMAMSAAEAGAAAPSRAAELEAQVAELTQKLERETYRSAQLAAQVKEKTRKHGELV